ncbi:MAG: hypothetical protein FWF49_03885, partial [Oscillospiraceae bacterium]|nr:hypothetical protein [Oscillospiraceae bacterium]
DGKNRISAYAAASILVALQYSVATKGTQYFDQTLYDDAVKYYNWIETNLRRTDHLYFVDFYGVNDDSGTPYGVVNPNQAIVEAGSPVALFLSMLMAEVQFELFKYTGDTQYQTLAVESANAIPATPLGNSGVLLNDRDAWTNAVFARYFVEDILPLPGIDQANWALMKNTALSIVQNCRTPDGYWGPDWGGGDKWITQTANSPAGFKTVPQQIMTTANTINLVVAAAIAEKNGQFG